MREFCLTFKDTTLLQIKTSDKFDLVEYWFKNQDGNIIVSNEFNNIAFNANKVLFVREYGKCLKTTE
jgi:hypothetical protein